MTAIQTCSRDTFPEPPTAEVPTREPACRHVVENCHPRHIQAHGAAGLFQSASREATILAFNDVFRFVAMLALAVALFLCCLVLRDLLRGRFQATQQVSA